jgi:uncharacterized protein
LILTDTGPIVALLDASDPNHARCLAAAKKLPIGPLITTLPCFTEAMHFVEREGGFAGILRLWGMQASGRLVVHAWNADELIRAKALMTNYRDSPMDFADASIVAAAETLGVKRVFTLDGHFFAYQINGKASFEVLP